MGELCLSIQISMRAALQPPSQGSLWDIPWDVSRIPGCSWNPRALQPSLTSPPLLCSSSGFSESLHCHREAEPGMLEAGILWELTSSEPALVKFLFLRSAASGVCFLWGQAMVDVDVGKHSGLFPCGVLLSHHSGFVTWDPSALPISQFLLSFLFSFLCFFPDFIFLF